MTSVDRLDQQRVDASNAEFWEELCGSGWARMLGITGTEPDALERFDNYFFAYYPYLARRYIDGFQIEGRRVLEIGLGYGTLGHYLASRGADYHGVDIASTPVAMMEHRLGVLNIPTRNRVAVGSAHAIPYPNDFFDFVYSIGCLHHTGNIAKGVAEIHRVLAPGGVAVVMLYNRYSARQLWRVDRMRVASALLGRGLRSPEQVRADYDQSESGAPAPHTDFTSHREARRLFRDYSRARVRAENIDDVYRHNRLLITRGRLLDTIAARALGLDLYIVARK